MLSLVIISISIIAQIFICVEVGGLSSTAISYSLEGSAAFAAALVVLLFIAVRFFVDRMYVKGTGRIGFSPIVTDVAMYTVGTVVMVVSLELFAGNNISRPLAITIISAMLFMLVEKDVYLHPDVYGKKIEKSILDDLDDEPDELSDDSNDDSDNGSSDDLKESGEEEKLWPEEEEKQEFVDETEDQIKNVEDSLAEALKIAESLSVNTSDETGDNMSNEPVEESGNPKRELEAEGVEKEVSFVSKHSDDEDSEDDEYEDDDFKPDNSGRIVVTEIIKNLMYIATAVFGAFVLRDVFAQKYGVLYYMVLVLSALLCVILRAIYRGSKLLAKEETGTKTALVSYFVTSAIYAVFFGYFSVLIGLVYLLGAFVVRMILPWAFDNWGSGGTAVVCRRKDTVSRVVTRVFALIIVLIAVWQLSYGVLWETEFLMIIAVAITSMEPLLKQNLYFEEPEESNTQEEKNNPQEEEKILDENAIG
ncbi:MAG: hypothetical protein J5929_08415 [Eubacterium sp.]|nr:hypothetical protein [Eubacterium sp.]